MKQLCAILILIPLAALLAPAQEQDVVQIRMKADLEKMVAEAKVVGLGGGAMGPTVKGAPYSAVEINETTQVLADGTRIHNEFQTKIFRDNEGRVRRETPDQVTIWDPVNNASYFLDPKTQSARKATMHTIFFNTGKIASGAAAGRVTTVAGEPVAQTFEYRVRDGVATASINGEPADPAELKRMQEKSVAEAGTVAHIMPPPENVRYAAVRKLPPAQSESLGNRMIEGVNCEGTRSVTKIEAGAIGNDRPIEITYERWYSPDLQTVVMTRRNDPRTGEEIFRVTNVIRSEPGGDLFQVPSTYQLLERK